MMPKHNELSVVEQNRLSDLQSPDKVGAGGERLSNVSKSLLQSNDILY